MSTSMIRKRKHIVLSMRRYRHDLYARERGNSLMAIARKYIVRHYEVQSVERQKQGEDTRIQT